MGRGRVRLADRNAVLEARPGETLLEVLERNGYHPQFSCRVGSCGTCKLRRVSGQVREVAEVDPSVLSPQERAQGYVLSCVSQPVGEVTLASILPTPAAFDWRGAAVSGSPGDAHDDAVESGRRCGGGVLWRMGPHQLYTVAPNGRWSNSCPNCNALRSPMTMTIPAPSSLRVVQVASRRSPPSQ